MLICGVNIGPIPNSAAADRFTGTSPKYTCRRGVFASYPNRLFFSGHFHQWFAASSLKGILDWDGNRPIVLDPAERYFVVINAVMDGWCATFDSVTNLLTPVHVGPRK